MVETMIQAQKREEYGKGAARRIRRSGMVPATLNSRGEVPIHVSLPGHDTFLALRRLNAVMEIDLDGEKTLTVAREVQRHPVTDVLLHVDLMVVRRGEKIEANVPVRIEGEPTAGVAVLDMQELRVIAEATNVPGHLAVSVDGLSDGSAKYVKDLVVPEGVEILEDPEATVVTVTVPRMMDEDVQGDAEGADAGEDSAEEA